MVHLTDLTLAGAKASVEIEKAYHLFAILCHLRRPCSIPEIVSRCTLFDVSEEYVVYLCGSEGSPVCVTMSGDVSVSVDGVGSVGGLMGRAVGRYVPRVVGPGKGMGRLGIGGVSSGASWKKRKRCWEESKGCLRLPARRRRLFTDEERCQIKNIWGSGCGGGGGEVMEV